MFQSPLPIKDDHTMDSTDLVDKSARAADNISRLISAMRRQAKLFAAFSLSGVAAGTLYVMTATPFYTASTSIIIDNRQVRAVRDVSTLSDPTRLVDAPEIVESQVEVLRSDKVGLAVINNLNLSTEDPAFARPNWIDKIWASVMVKLDAIIGAPRPDQTLKRQQKVLEALNSNLRIIRVGRSFVVRVDYTSPNPARAAEIANAYANAYILEKLTSDVAALHRAQSWLQQRTEELRHLSVDTDLAAQKFRANNNLLTTRGTPVAEQQLSEMATGLVNARAATAQARARYEGIKNIIDTHQTESAVTESLANPVINGLRTKYLNESHRADEFERKLGASHLVVVNLKNSMKELSTALFQELGRVAQSYKNDYEAAAARERSLINSMTQQQGTAVAANDAQVQLRQLEEKARSYNTLYQTFLQRYQETAQQEGFPLTDAHIISAASQPGAPSYPRTALVLAITLALGTVAGISIAILREFTDHVFRTAGQVRDELGVAMLGMLPAVDPTSLAQAVPNITPPILRYAIDDPFSAFTETLRSAIVAADLALRGKCPKIIGLVSLFPKEGKSTVAKNFASLLAFGGAKTLLIDADTRNPTLTRAIGCERRQSSQSGLSTPPLAELIKDEPDTGLQILPSIYAKDDPRVAKGLSSAMLQALLQSSDRSFEYIVIDLPPIGLTANARGMASGIDAFIFVVEWGMTSRGAVRAALAEERPISDKLLGVILNKVDMKKLKFYEHK
ncbi:MAG: GNVR domain-containing protein, partial [Gammaproteobacteria bacterium]